MHRIPATLGGVLLVGAVWIGRMPPMLDCRVTLRLVDADSHSVVPGLIRIVDESGTVLHPPELLSRGAGLPADAPLHEWSVVPRGEAEITLPATKVRISGIAGLETERGELELDLTGKSRGEARVSLRRFSTLRGRGWASGNTHLHLQKMSREEADRYLREIPRGDDLDVVFVSYLERAEVDRAYTTNRYTKEELARLSEGTAVLGWGEEHRHNFGHGGEGYGHVMLLDLKELVLPVSIGPGIMQRDSDGIPLQRGIVQAKGQGGTVIWCHNDWGLENVPNWVMGRLDAQNIFDGSIRSSYQDSFYPLLNAGLVVPFSTGTDWFQYDFSRVYVPVEGDLTTRNWLAALRSGKSFITNGPLLEFTVNDAGPGDRLFLKQAGVVTVSGRGVGRVDFRRLELVHNGRVIRVERTGRVGGHYEAKLNTTLPIDEPGWLALRTPPPPVEGSPEPSETVARNEFGRALFSHTSPVYVSLEGKELFDRAAVEALCERMERNLETISREGKFADDEERRRVLEVHAEALNVLQKRLGERRSRLSGEPN